MGIAILQQFESPAGVPRVVSIGITVLKPVLFHLQFKSGLSLAGISVK